MTNVPSPKGSVMSARPRSLASAGALGLVGLAVLTACGGSSSGSTAAAAPSATSSGAASGGAASARERGPAASGLVAAADGSTLQVQNQQDGQVAVTWSASTTFTQQVTVAASAIKAGDCVVAASTSGDGTGTSFTATTVRVTAAVDGECTGATGGGGRFPGGDTGGRPSGAPTGGVPSGFPADGTRPSGAPTRTGTVATGAVVSVSGDTIVVAARRFGDTSGTPTASSTPTTVDTTVTVGSGTTVTTEQKATSAAATVGRCVTAEGTADSTGAVAATSIAVTDAVDGACTSGFGGFGGPPNGGAAASGTTHG